MEPYGLDAIVALNRLPYFKTGTSAYGRSSYDASGGNNDSLPTADAIILNVLGPGVVYRMWFTGFAHDATIDFYFDDESTPRDYILRELFTGEVDAFQPPLVGIGSGGGYYCYVPLPFRHSLRVKTNGAAQSGRAFFYNIGYHLYTPGTDVVSWTGQEDTTAARGLWELAKDGMDPFPGGEAKTGRLDARPKSDTIIAMLDGPAVITCLRFRAEEGVLDHLCLRMFWDDEPDAAVDVPMRMFFARGYYSEGELSRSLVVGIDAGGWHYTYFPMPFQARARLFIRNPSDRLVAVSFELHLRPFENDFSHVGYFRTRYSRHFPLNPSSIRLLDVAGSGHLAGVVASVEGPDVQDQTTEGWDRRCYHTNELCFLEGDEQIFVDGESAPAIQGTGMEDFFNAAWYFGDGPFNTPLAGCTLKRIEHGHGRTSAYRLFLQDAVPFRKHIRMCLERGPENDVPVLAWTLAYYYYQPIVRLSGDSGPSLRSPRVPSSATISVVSRSIDKLDLFVVDDSGVVVTAAWEPSRADWYNWGPITSAVADPRSPVDAVSRSKDKLDVFFTDTNGEVRTVAWASGQSEWQSSGLSSRLRPGSGLLPEILAGAPVSAVVRRVNHIDIFAPDKFGHIHTAAWPEPNPVPGTEGAHWAGWWPTELFSKELAPARVVSRSFDKLDVFTTNKHGEIFTAAWEPSSAWKVWKLEDRLAPGAFRPAVDPGAIVTAVSRFTDHLDIFVIGTDGSVYSAAWQPGFAHWAGWWKLRLPPEVRGVSGKAANVVSKYRDESLGASSLDLFFTGPEGAIHSASWDPKGGWNYRLVKNAADHPKVEGGAPVAVVSRRQQHLDIFVAGLDRRIWTAAWDPHYGPWHPWKPIGY